MLFCLGCNEDDPVTRTFSGSDFVGAWAGHSNSTTSCNTAVNNSTSQPCGTNCNSYTFTKTTFKFTTKFGNHEGPYTVKGDSILMPALAQMGLSKRTFKIEGNNLTLSSKDANTGCITNSVYVK